MFKVIATDVVVSKGYKDTPALRFSEKGDSVKFRIGKRVYDSRAENNTRWINMTVKAFGPVCERIRKMQLKDGSFVHLAGRLDEEHWTDQETNEPKSMMVIILDEIEYASGGGAKAKDDQSQQPANSGAGQAAPAQAAPAVNSQEPTQNPSNFTGYEPFGTGSFFDEN